MKQAPVQSEFSYRHPKYKPAGLIDWEEFLEAYQEYIKKYGTSQSAERIAERGGFGYYELVKFLKREPRTWKEKT